jgi:chemotaxis protein CheD
MHRHFSAKFNREIVTVHPGEYFATHQDAVISTVLGSCIAVALHDPDRRIGGLNHFMLPGSLDRGGGMYGESGKYGIFAMEYLVNELIRLGASRQGIRAKVFGGSHVLKGTVAGADAVPQANIRFAFDYLDTEGIPIDTSDVGGTAARRIYLYPISFRVLLKRITDATVQKIEQEEEQYLEAIREKRTEGDVTLF